ncbi:MAG: ATP-binding protein, partial [Gammaproteobacteria bacterium]|nr:ATP-binding protein [Gammaproteobacteria bacterium]
NNKEKLIEAKNIATQANKAKSEFLSSMSHELRTPLNAILGFSQLLQLNNELSSVNKENVQEILSAGNHLLELINDVLDLSIIEAGQIHLSIEAVDVGLMFQECVALVKIMAEKKDIRISHSGTTGIFVRTDYTRLKQVLLNLLSNAIKYNHSGGSIIMSFFVTENQLLRITISDTGMGINSDKMDDLFEPFQRLGAENSAIEGTGIGLTLSKKIVELMGTKINVESKVDVGSTFWFELPIDSSI